MLKFFVFLCIIITDSEAFLRYTRIMGCSSCNTKLTSCRTPILWRVTKNIIKIISGQQQKKRELSLLGVSSKFCYPVCKFSLPNCLQVANTARIKSQRHPVTSNKTVIPPMYRKGKNC
uniref:Secreted protein n=1 Tax=Populus trichocarpa TaxID=3694 RepID=A0A2K1YBJ4_POPTR